MKTIHESKKSVLEDMASGVIQFQKLSEQEFEMPSDRTLPSELVVVGIGGSSKGFLMLQNALKPFSDNVFVLDSFDPCWMSEAKRRVLSGAGVLIVSKSGGTLETIELADFLLASENAATWVGVVTDHGSRLDEQAHAQDWVRFHIPSAVGGRFSVLSPVGLVPASFFGLDVEQLLSGAQSLWQEEQAAEGPAERLADRLWASICDGRSVMLLAYSNRLQGFLDWLTQLWWESLGQVDKDGIRRGPLLLSGIGPHAQHSVGQLLRDGPSDKYVLGLCLSGQNGSLVETRQTVSEGYLSRRSPESILNLQAKSTLTALSEVGQITSYEEIPRLDEYHLGRLIMQWQLAVSYLGYALQVEPFLQPGVERGKILINQALNENV